LCKAFLEKCDKRAYWVEYLENELENTVFSEPILVGREKEFEQLQIFLNSALASKGKTVFVSGQAGSGKTRLVKEFLNLAKKRGVAVLCGWCLSNAAVPYFPFFEAFSQYFTGDQSEEGEIVIPKLEEVNSGFTQQLGPQALGITAMLMGPNDASNSGRPQTFSPQAWKDQTFAAVATTLSAIAAHEPVILFIDDIHWADSASLALIHYITRTVAKDKVLLLATYRSEHPITDSEGRATALIETLRSMKRDDLLNEIKISPLNQKAVFSLASNLLGGELQTEFSDKLFNESQGNPLFVVESVRMLHERDSLRKDQEKWRLKNAEIGIPDKIRDILLQRLSGLSHNYRKVLDAASIVGERFDPQLLASILAIDFADVLETLEAIGKTTSLVCCEGELYRFDHARSREAVYSEIAPPLKRVYHAKIGETLERVRKNGDLFSTDLAYHFAQAGNEEKAIKYSLEAGQQALARWSNAEATESFRYALQRIGEKTEHLMARAEALEGLGDALYATNRFIEATKLFEELSEIQNGPSKLRAFRKAIVAAFYQCDVTKIKELTGKAEPYAAIDRVEAARIADHKARFGGEAGDLATSIMYLKQALCVYEEEYCLPDAAWDLFVLGRMDCLFGDCQTGIASVLRSIKLYDELGDVHSQLEAYSYATEAFGDYMLREETIDWAIKVIETDARLRLNDYIRLIPAYFHLSNFLWGRLDLTNAGLLLEKSLDFCSKTESNLYIGEMLACGLAQSSFREDIISAERYHEMLEALPKEALSNTQSLFWVNIANALFNAAKGLFSESDRCLKEYEKIIQNVKAPNIIAWVKTSQSWILFKQGKNKEARSLWKEAQAMEENAHKQFIHTNIVPGILTLIHPNVNQPFEIRLDLVNTSRSQGAIVKIEDMLLPQIETINISPNCIAHDSSIEFKENVIRSFEVKTIKLTAKVTKPQVFDFTPKITYICENGETKQVHAKPVTFTIKPTNKPQTIGKISTGTPELDELLLGGISEKLAVALTTSALNERQKIINRFIESGAQNEEPTFFITDQLSRSEELAQKYPAYIRLFACSPRAIESKADLPNVSRLKGVENLTEIDITLTKAIRQLGSPASPRRICIEIVSQVLLEHHAVITRKWLSGLLQDLKSKGFTIMAVINPLMHSKDEVEAILSVFDGEISLDKKESAEGVHCALRVQWLSGQDYIPQEATISEE
jgi:tetratricopeptide (TPR) repeat protein/KaiC/GvpD/RAD55 family RecA-like ATPase